MVVEHSADQASFDRVILNQQNRFDRSFNDPIHHAGIVQHHLANMVPWLRLEEYALFYFRNSSGSSLASFAHLLGGVLHETVTAHFEDPKQY